MVSPPVTEEREGEAMMDGGLTLQAISPMDGIEVGIYNWGKGKRPYEKESEGMTLLVIDVQKGIADERLYDFDNFVIRLKTLIEKARGRGVEVIYVQHDDGPGSGFSVGDEDYEILPLVAPIEGERVYRKTANSCFSNKEL